MLKALDNGSDEQRLVLSNLSPGPAQVRLAAVLVVATSVVFALITFGPLKGVHLRRVDAFIAFYLTCMFACDLITAILLYAQFSILRSRAILVIASGYLFTALALVPFALAYPGLLAPGLGLFGGPQSTSWLWFTWHFGFPLYTIAYALLVSDTRSARRFWRGTVGGQIAWSAFWTAAAVGAAAAVCLGAEPILPRVASASALFFTPLWPLLIGAPVAAVNIAALVLLGRNRKRSVLDLWLVVVTILHIFEVSLAYYPDAARFSVGSYAVRTIGIVASGLVLTVLLHEITTLYGSIVDIVLRQRSEREARRMTGDLVAAAVAHEVRQPMTAIITTADAGLRFLDRPEPHLERAKEAFRRVAEDGHRAASMIDSIRSGYRRHHQVATSLDVNELIQSALALESDTLQRNRIVVRFAPNPRLPHVHGNRVELQQVMLNLITNAIAAMANNGFVPKVLTVRADGQEDGMVVIAVEDTGSGINAQDAEKVFHPRFTTKPDGMGIGLSICNAIVEAHEGRIWVTANAPRGCVFRFSLRACPAQAAA